MKKTGCHSAQKTTGTRQDYASGIGIMCQGPLPAFPVGLGHEAWAFWLGQGSGTNLADCPDHAESLDSQGLHARDWRKSRPSPWHNAGHREKFREPPTDEVDGPRICAQGLVVVHLVHGRLHVQIVGRTAHVE